MARTKRGNDCRGLDARNKIALVQWSELDDDAVNLTSNRGF